MKLDDLTRCSSLVVRILGLNPGPFTLAGTNTYLVGAGKSRVLVEAGEGMDGYVPLLLKAMKSEGVETISDVLITHYHRDHCEGLTSLREQFGDSLRAWKVSPSYLGEHGPSFDLAEMGVKELADGDVVRTENGDATLRVMTTPGHTLDHCCFVLEEEGAVFSGDCVLGGSSGVFEDLSSYMRSLNKMLSVLPAGDTEGGSGARRIYPGHGPVIEDGHAAVQDYIKHRNAREEQVAGALKQSTVAQYIGLSPWGIVRRVYPSLSLKLQIAAAFNVEKHLEKLRDDGNVRSRSIIPFGLPLRFFGIRLDRIFFCRWRWLR